MHWNIVNRVGPVTAKDIEKLMSYTESEIIAETFF